MIELNVLTIIGLIGITLVITTGKIFDELRRWLLSFHVWFNPLRVLGEVMSCTMCAGWWVGAVWAVCNGTSWGAAIVIGGILSVLSFTADEVLTILVATSTRSARGLRPMPQALPPPPPVRAQRAPEDPAINEDEAHAILDKADEGE